MANTSSLLQFGSIVNFSTYPSNIIGAQYTEVKVLGLLDKQTANLWIDADTLHPNVYPTLPPGTPDDPDAYQYVKLIHTNGSISVIGLPWIIADTIEVSTKGHLTIEFSDASPGDREVIIRALAANGYQPSKIKHI